MRRKDSGDLQQLDSYLEPLDPDDVQEEQEIEMATTKKQKNPNTAPKPPSAIKVDAGRVVDGHHRAKAAALAPTPRTRLVKQVIAIGKRLQKLDARVGGHELLHELASKAFDAAEALEAGLPDDWRPARTGGGKKADWEPGKAVRVSECWRKHYDGLLLPKEMDGLELVAVNGKAATCKLPDGASVRVRLRHLSERP